MVLLFVVCGWREEAVAGVCRRTYSVHSTCFFLYQGYDIPVSGEAHCTYNLRRSSKHDWCGTGQGRDKKDVVVAECKDDADGAPNVDFGFDNCIPPRRIVLRGPNWPLTPPLGIVLIIVLPLRPTPSSSTIRRSVIVFHRDRWLRRLMVEGST